ncbi:MAG: L-seryl-tRNA(Sec) selenium transferase, partial [Chloroflexi bacterium]|nr:L-seryl-tRNA(Sec) selenium transferase [Chloroflexota bacterium]
KLLGGPQAGVIVGRKDLVDKMKKHPLARAIRLDKMTIAALEATLIEYLDPENALKLNPTLRMITEDRSIVRERARRIGERIQAVAGGSAAVTVEDEVARVGGGSLPLAEIPSAVVAVRSNRSCAEVEEALRCMEPAVIVRVKEEAILVDPRTVQPSEEGDLVQAFENVFSGGDA